MENITIDYKNKYLLIKVSPVYIYDISFEDLRKHEEEWFDHLCEKNWFVSHIKVEYAKAIRILKNNDYGKAKNG